MYVDLTIHRVGLLFLLLAGGLGRAQTDDADGSADRTARSGPGIRFFGHLDRDLDVDFLDFRIFQTCMTGPVSAVQSGCSAAEGVRDGHIDLRDFGRFQRELEGTVTRIRGSSPTHGELAVGTTRETIVDFLQPVARVMPGGIVASVAGQTLTGFHQISGNRRRVWLFYDAELPSGTEVTVTIDGSQFLDKYRNGVDADGDGLPGGITQFSFTTIDLSSVVGTRVHGRILNSDPGPDGNDVPLAGVTVSVAGRPELNAITDELGNFELHDAPVGDFFVQIDGATEVLSQGMDGPLDYYFPTFSKPFHDILADEINVIPFDIHLPKVMKADVLTPIDPSQEIVVTSTDPRLTGMVITIPANSLVRENRSEASFVGVGAVALDRLPEPLPFRVDPPVLFTFQSDATNLRVPAAVRFPNLDNLQAGEKSALWSFNHDTGRYELAGAMTVDPTGRFVDTDLGVGISAPGLHFIQPGLPAGLVSTGEP